MVVPADPEASSFGFLALYGPLYLRLTVGEQERVIELLRAARAQADALVNARRNAAKLAEQLERTALAKAFRCELVKQAPSDEPPSALLERLRVVRYHHQPDAHGEPSTQSSPRRAQKRSRTAAKRPGRTEQSSKSVER